MASMTEGGAGALGGAASGAGLGSIIPGVGTAVGGIVGGLTGLLGGIFGGGPSEEEKALQDTINAIDSLEVPPEEKRRIKYELLQKVGEYKPELEAAVVQKDTELQNITTDPVLRQAQMSALTKLSQIGQEGLTLEEQAASEDALGAAARSAQSQREAALQNAAQRGTLGSGQEFAAALAGGQQAADQGYKNARDLAAMAQKRMLEGTLQAGQLGGQLRTQDYNEQSDKARAQDIINQFNTNQQAAVQQRNVGAKNIGQQGELDYARQIAAKNTGLKNQEQEKNIAATVDTYRDQLSKAQTKGNLQSQLAGKASQSSANNAAGWANIGQSIGGIGAGIDGYLSDDTGKKKPVV